MKDNSPEVPFDERRKKKSDESQFSILNNIFPREAFEEDQKIFQKKLKNRKLPNTHNHSDLDDERSTNPLKQLVNLKTLIKEQKIKAITENFKEKLQRNNIYSLPV